METADVNSARHRSSRIWALLRTEVLQTSYTCAPGDLSARFWALPPLKSFTSPLFTDQGLPHQIPPRNSEPKLSRAEAGRGLGRSRSLERVPADQGEKKKSRFAFSCLIFELVLHPALLPGLSRAGDSP